MTVRDTGKPRLQDRRLRTFVVAVALSRICSVAFAADPPAAANKPAAPQTQHDCAARGGEWILFPAGQFHFCRLAAGDSGKRCNAASECEGDCRAVRAADDNTLHGECSQYVIMPGGCPVLFENGKALSEPCV